MTTALTSKQKQSLKSLAHPLSPIVRIGRAGASESVISEAKKSLAAHELIKVRIDSDDSASRRALAEQLATGADASIVGIVGKIAILYRPNDDEAKRTIRI